MRSRFPHGGEVLGAAPANPILAPVLSQDRGLRVSRQRDLLDLQAIQRIPGFVGYWKRDPQYMFEDSAGTTPASTSGTGPVGSWNAVNASYALGSEINTTPATWTAQAEITNNGDGSYSWVATTAARAVYFTIGELSGTLRVSFTLSGVTAASVRLNYKGSYLNTAITTAGEHVLNLILVPGGGTTFYIESATGSTFALSNISLKTVSTNSAFQATTANKPILRKTPTTGVYWSDSNTATSALNVALGNLGSACTVARSSAEGVTFTENVSITSTYNIAPAYGFNSDVAIFNRALTATEKALITRYMARAVPMLGANLVTNGTFDTDTTGWTPATSSLLSSVSGWLRITMDGGNSRYALQSGFVGSDFCLVKGNGRGNGVSYPRITYSASVSGTTSVLSQSLSLVGAATSLYLYAMGGTPDYSEFDDVSVRKIL